MAQEVVMLKARGTGKSEAKACRKKGLVPGVIYGKSIEPVAVALDASAVRRILTGAGVRIHHVKVDEPAFEGDVMVQDAVYDSLNGKPVHVDLHRISLTEKVKAEVPVVVIGEDGLVKSGLTVQRQLREIMVECLPTDIPEKVVVNVGDLGHGDAITAGEVSLPAKVKLLTGSAEVLVVAVAPKTSEEVEEAAPEAAAPAEGAAPAPEAGKPEAPKD